MALQFFIDRRPHNGLNYEEFLALMEHEAGLSDAEARDPALRRYTEMNVSRMKRAHKTYQMSNELESALKKVRIPQLWMVITEGWCGDSAHCLPVIEHAASASSFITRKIILRDSNPDIMDYYLTNGKRGIAKLVAFDEAGSELFRWGPRPVAAQRLFEDALAAGTPKGDVYRELQTWYNRNRGADLDRELTELINLGIITSD